MNGRMRALGVVAMLSLMAACARGPEETPLEIEMGQIIRDQIRQRRGKAAAPQPPVLTRALLETIEAPHIEVVIEKTDLRDYVTLQLARRDDSPGRIEVWRTVDNITFGFRDGMLISIRGLRGSLLSAEVPADGQGAMGPASGGQRSYDFAGDDNGSYRVQLACELRDLGPEPLDIVEITYATRHLQEYCTGPEGGVILNDYWVDSRSGRLWQSRQWAGPEVGYIRTRQVVI
ncbi:YjbF family lipoprotein [Phaeobacter sp. B1627]|nr:YjbF family lipoprotein [Phaeobacter sp. B1627]